VADSQFDVTYTFRKGSDNQGSVTPGKQPPAMVLLSNAGGNNPVAVPAVSQSAIEPQLVDGQRPLVLGNADQFARTDPVPVLTRLYEGVAQFGCAATLLAAMVVGQQEHGQAPHTVGF
jgi:hypothetical protein